MAGTWLCPSTFLQAWRMWALGDKSEWGSQLAFGSDWKSLWECTTWPILMLRPGNGGVPGSNLVGCGPYHHELRLWEGPLKAAPLMVVNMVSAIWIRDELRDCITSILIQMAPTSFTKASLTFKHKKKKNKESLAHSPSIIVTFNSSS